MLIAPAKDFSHLIAHAKASLPNTPGVYCCKNQDGKVLYVGKSIRIRDRVLQHIYASRDDVREARLCFASRTVDFAVTGTELIALLFESAEIKKLLPTFNRAQRRSRALWGWRVVQGAKKYYEISTERITEQKSFLEEKPFVREFLSQRGARGRLEAMLKEEGFCLSPGSGRACFWHQIDKCVGACAGKESADDYNARLMASVEKSAARLFRDQIIIGKGRHSKEKSYVVISGGKYEGYGFVPAALAANSQALERALVRESHNSDIQKILRAYFNEQEKAMISEILEPLLSESEAPEAVGL